MYCLNMDKLRLQDLINSEEKIQSENLYVYIPQNSSFLNQWSNRYYEKGTEFANNDIEFYRTSYDNTIRVESMFALIAPKSAFYDFSWINQLDLNQYTSVNFKTNILGRYIFEKRCVSVMELVESNSVICATFDSCLDLAEHIMLQNCEYSIVEDVFSGEKQILWKQNLNEVIPFAHFTTGDDNIINAIPLLIKTQFEPKPFVTLQNSKEQFVFQYRKKRFSTHRFVKGDTFHFVFQNTKHLQFQLKAPASNAKDSDYKKVSFSMLPQEIKQFANNIVTAIRCEFQNGDAPLELEWENEVSAILFKLYFQKYIEALIECGVDIDKIPAATESIKRPINELSDESTDASCFVYLMKDESNGYHKIGISNKPEYRERTLQSEKPTIVLLCAKKFPSRVIAEAIESALHKAYGYKRLRGEWFELDNKDVTEIVATLS